MIRGIIALFASGIITNPMVLCGIITGSILYACLDGSLILQVYKMSSFYAFAFLAAGVYILGFRRVYRPNGETDWVETLIAVFCAALKFIFASLLMISFINLFDMSDMDNIANSGL